MRAVVQRVSRASVTVEKRVAGSIGTGLLVLIGVERGDEGEDAAWLAGKIANMRIFNDEKGVMNLSVRDVGGEALVVSQFTLMASYKRGNRPSWTRAAGHETAVPLYEEFCKRLEEATGRMVQRGVFGAMMEVELLNDGPVTICMDSKRRE